MKIETPINSVCETSIHGVVHVRKSVRKFDGTKSSNKPYTVEEYTFINSDGHAIVIKAFKDGVK